MRLILLQSYFPQLGTTSSNFKYRPSYFLNWLSTIFKFLLLQNGDNLKHKQLLKYEVENTWRHCRRCRPPRTVMGQLRAQDPQRARRRQTTSQSTAAFPRRTTSFRRRSDWRFLKLGFIADILVRASSKLRMEPLKAEHLSKGCQFHCRRETNVCSETRS